MMASMEASNVSMCATPLSANPSRIRLCLRARAPMIASAYNYLWREPDAASFTALTARKRIVSRWLARRSTSPCLRRPERGSVPDHGRQSLTPVQAISMKRHSPMGAITNDAGGRTCCSLRIATAPARHAPSGQVEGAAEISKRTTIRVNINLLDGPRPKPLKLSHGLRQIFETTCVRNSVVFWNLNYKFILS